MPSRSGLARDARPPGPIAIVQSYGTVWSTEQQDYRSDEASAAQLSKSRSGARVCCIARCTNHDAVIRSRRQRQFSQSLAGLSAGAAMMTSRVFVWRLRQRRQWVKSIVDHDLGKKVRWGLGWFRCPSSNSGNAIVVCVPLPTFGRCTVQM